MLSVWKLNLCSPGNIFYQQAFVHLCFFNISSSLLWKTFFEVRPQTRLRSRRITTVWIPIQLLKGICPPSRGNNAGSSLVRDSNSPRVVEEQNNLTEAGDVSKDSLQAVAFVLMGTEGHHTMGCILHEQEGDNVTLLSWHNHGRNAAEMFWPVDHNRSNAMKLCTNYENQIFESINICTFPSFCCPRYWGEQTRPFNWKSCVWFDITNEPWWGRGAGSFSWAPSGLQKALLPATGKHYAKEGNMNTVRWGGEGEHCPWTTIACSVGVNFLSLNKAVMKFPRLISPYLPTRLGHLSK